MAKIRLSEDLGDVFEGKMPILYYPLLEEAQEGVIEGQGQKGQRNNNERRTA
jgi:hypothetical protein